MTSIVTEDDLHAWADGRLGPERRTEVEAWLATQPEARAKADGWRAQNDALRSLARDALDEPVPRRLLDAITTRGSGWRQMGMAAAVAGLAAGLVMGLAGWFGHGWYASGGGTLGQSAAAKRFARDAMVAHAVYSPEVRHPVEVAAAEQQHLVQWLSKRLGAPIKAPVLSAQGFELVGGRLLPGEAGARAQFMYQNAAGERVTVYVCASARGMASQPTAFRFEQNGPVSAFYWVDRDFNYALSGEMSRARLMQLSDQVYQQLNG